MKPKETIFKRERIFAVIALLCFIYAGYSILSFGLQAYTSVTRLEIPEFNAQDTNLGDNPLSDSNYYHDFFAQRFGRNRLDFTNSPLSIVYLVSGIISLLAGIAIVSMLREKDHKKIKNSAVNELLLPDEKKVISAITSYGSALTQSKIVLETGLSKVQAHRAIKKLESKGIVEKHQYGSTNKILMKKKFLD